MDLTADAIQSLVESAWTNTTNADVKIETYDALGRAFARRRPTYTQLLEMLIDFATETNSEVARVIYDVLTVAFSAEDDFAVPGHVLNILLGESAERDPELAGYVVGLLVVRGSMVVKDRLAKSRRALRLLVYSKSYAGLAHLGEIGLKHAREPTEMRPLERSTFVLRFFESRVTETELDEYGKFLRRRLAENVLENGDDEVDVAYLRAERRDVEPEIIVLILSGRNMLRADKLAPGLVSATVRGGRFATLMAGALSERGRVWREEISARFSHAEIRGKTLESGAEIAEYVHKNAWVDAPRVLGFLSRCGYDLKNMRGETFFSTGEFFWYARAQRWTVDDMQRAAARSPAVRPAFDAYLRREFVRVSLGIQRDYGVPSAVAGEIGKYLRVTR